MNNYLFIGLVLPERAQLSHHFSCIFSVIASGDEGKIEVSIILNQIVIRAAMEREWELHDLRNLVKSILQNELAILGYLLGYAYDLEITRVINVDRGIDYVFGIDIPCINSRKPEVNINLEIQQLRQKILGERGVFLNRCFADLSSAMKNADDTGFYCYRAIESLRHHCSVTYGLTEETKLIQWQKFREISGSNESNVRYLKNAADALRHGEAVAISGEERGKLFGITWDIVDGYLNNTNA